MKLKQSAVRNLWSAALICLLVLCSCSELFTPLDTKFSVTLNSAVLSHMRAAVSDSSEEAGSIALKLYNAADNSLLDSSDVSITYDTTEVSASMACQIGLSVYVTAQFYTAAGTAFGELITSDSKTISETTDFDLTMTMPARCFYVNTAASENGSGTAASPFSTLSAALTAYKTQLSKGITGSYTIYTAGSVTGTDSTAAVIDADVSSYDDVSLVLAGGYSVTDGVWTSSSTPSAVTGADSTAASLITVCLKSGGSLTVSNFSFESTTVTDSAVKITGAGSVTFSGCTVTGITGAADGYALSASGSASVLLNGCSFSGNTTASTDTYFYTLSVQNSGTFTIDGSIVFDSETEGVLLGYDTDASVSRYLTLGTNIAPDETTTTIRLGTSYSAGWASGMMPLYKADLTAAVISYFSLYGTGADSYYLTAASGSSAGYAVTAAYSAATGSVTYTTPDGTGITLSIYASSDTKQTAAQAYTAGTSVMLLVKADTTDVTASLTSAAMTLTNSSGTDMSTVFSAIKYENGGMTLPSYTPAGSYNLYVECEYNSVWYTKTKTIMVTEGE